MAGTFQNLEAFAPAAEWEELSMRDRGETRVQGNGHDLQLHADQSVPALPQQLSLPLSGWMAGKGNACSDGLRPLL